MYLWDANIFIEAARLPVTTFKRFWEDVDGVFQEKKVLSISEVKREIISLDGKMKEVFTKHRPFLTPTEEELMLVAEILQNPKYEGFIKRKNWMNGNPVADPFLVSVAKVRNLKVVTNENRNPGGARIPEACKDYNVPCVNFEEFMGEMGWQY